MKIGQRIFYYNDYPTKKCLQEVFIKKIINSNTYLITTIDNYEKVVKRSDLYESRAKYKLKLFNDSHQYPIDIDSNIRLFKEANILVVCKCCQTCKYIYKQDIHEAFEFCSKFNKCLSHDGYSFENCKNFKDWELNTKLKKKHRNIEILSKNDFKKYFY